MTHAPIARRLALGGLVCALCFAWGWWIQRPFAKAVLTTPLPPVHATGIDTSLVLADAGRYELVLDLAVAPGEERGPILGAGPQIDYTATLGAVTVRTGDDGPNGMYGRSDDSMGFVVAFLRAERGDTLRLQVRSLDSLDARRDYSPTIIVRRHYVEAMHATFRQGALQLLGLLALIVGVGTAIAAAWRRARARAATDPLSAESPPAA